MKQPCPSKCLNVWPVRLSYRERLTLNKDITLQAVPEVSSLCCCMLLCTPALRHCCLPCLSHVTVAAAAVQGAKVVVTWETSSPYQPVLHCTSGCHAAIRGITMRHASPSVADNYAVHLQVCLLSADLLLRQARCGSVAQRAARCLQHCLICADAHCPCFIIPVNCSSLLCCNGATSGLNQNAAQDLLAVHWSPA